MKKTKQWLIDWFKSNSNTEESVIINNLNEDYFSKKWINSLKFYSLITDIENEFKIRFSNDDFLDRKFATINGLSGIIEEKNNAE